MSFDDSIVALVATWQIVIVKDWDLIRSRGTTGDIHRA